jgi:tRNA-specific adenosine deaminase 1
MTADADAIADCVLATFDRLPDKRKPRPRNDGSKEWVPLAGIVLSKGNLFCCIRQALWLTLIALVKTIGSLAFL